MKKNKLFNRLWQLLPILVVSFFSQQIMAQTIENSDIEERLNRIEERLSILEESDAISEIIRYNVGSQSSVYNGLEVAMMKSNNIYVFWLEGELKKPINTSHHAPTYLLQSTTGKDAPKDNLCKVLSGHHGKTTVGTIWLKSDNGIEKAPLYFDNTGIYFQPVSTIKNVSVLKFTQMLILKEL